MKKTMRVESPSREDESVGTIGSTAGKDRR